MKNVMEKHYSKEVLKIILKDVDAIDYQIEMINSNSLLVNIEKNIFNNDVELNYNISKLISIKEYLKDKKINKHELINTFEEVFNAINVCKDYLLCEKNLLMSPEDIFIEKDSLKVKLIYIPIETMEQEDINNNFKKFIKEVIVELAIIEDLESDNFVQILLNFVKDNNLTINNFSNILLNLKKTKPDKITKENASNMRVNSDLISKNKAQSNSDSENQIKKNNINSQKQSQNNTNLRNQHRNNINSQKQIKNEKKALVKNKFNENVANEKSHKEEYEIKLIYKPIRKIIAISIQIIFFILLIVAITFIGKVETSQVASGILLIIVLDVLVLRILLNKEKMIKVRVKSKHNKNISNEKTIKSDKSMNLKKKQITNEDFNNNINLSKTHNTEFVDSNPTEIIDSSVTELIDSSETTLLQFNPYFLINKDGVSERIYIVKDVFIIGRMSNVSDYVINNSAIGRTHIQILKRDNKVYLKDLKSKNGTFVNGQRLVEEEVLLKNDDKVTIANVDMIFKVA